MIKPNLKRRDFHKLSVAALGGLMSGTMAGCGGETETSAPAGGENGETASSDAEIPEHACRGLNECKTAQNDCRGQGSCATEAWHHSCAEMNECKGRGGCGENPLANECKGMGECAIPLMDPAWEIARERMEEKWTEADKTFGDPPAKKES